MILLYFSSVRFNFRISEYKAAYGKKLAVYVAPGYKRRRLLDRWLLAISRERMHSFCVCYAIFSGQVAPGYK